MNLKTIENQNLLAYRLREGVKYYGTNCSFSLVLDYPLKMLILNPIWQPVIHRLAGGPFIPFEEILLLIENKTSDQVESFLNELNRKGFLESKGYRELNEYPFVSIIIPVRNRPLEIKRCLESLERLDYPPDKIETIVVDDASTDNTPDIIRGFDVQLISMKDQKQASFCRNHAAKIAKGEILAFLDSDCTAESKWLKALVPAFVDHSTGAAGGLVDSAFHAKGLDRYEKAKSSLNMGSWPKSTREGDMFFYLPSCNLLVRSEAFRKLGGFREDMHVGEDVDLCWRMWDLDRHVEYRPSGIVYHRHRNDIKNFCSRRFDYGTSEPILQRMYHDRVKKLIFPLSNLFFYGAIFIFLITGWIGSLGLCGVSILIDSLIKYKRIRRKKIPIRYPKILLVTFRGYLSFVYNISSFFSRYYLFVFLPLIFVIPMLAIILLSVHLLIGVVEYSLKKSRINLLTFLFYFTLEQLSYQAGVWWGCVKCFHFQPVNPRLIWKAE